MRHLAWMMSNIAAEQPLFAVRPDENAHMARTMAGGWDQRDFITAPGIAGDEIGLAGIDDRLHRVVENCCLVGLVAVVAPVLIFGFAEHIARISESRHPLAAG